MNANQSTSIDPCLQRLNELTDRIRRRAAEDRARKEAKSRRHGQRELPLRLTPLPPRRAAPVPRHWSDCRDDEQNAA
jgi:hypothetical protein